MLMPKRGAASRYLFCGCKGTPLFQVPQSSFIRKNGNVDSCNLADVAQVVAVIVVEGEVVLTGIADLCRLTVALVELVLVDATVLQREKAAEEVLRGVRELYLRGGQLPAAAHGTLLSHLSCHKCIVIGDSHWQNYKIVH